MSETAFDNKPDPSEERRFWKSEFDRLFVNCSPTRRPPHEAVNQVSTLTSAAAVVRRVIDTVVMWRERARRRREFLTVDERTCRDIGISRSQVLYESSKPFWRE